MGYIRDEHRNAITLSAMERWKRSRFRRTIKELSQFDNKKPEELESEFDPEFDHFDLDTSHPSSPFKGRNIVDLDSCTNNYMMGIKLAKLHYP